MTITGIFVILIYLMWTSNARPGGLEQRESSVAAALPAALHTWIEETVGAPIGSAQRVAAGGRRLGFAVDVLDTEVGPALYLAIEPADATAADRPSGLRREFDVYARLARDGVRVPRVIAVHPTVDAMLMERVPGHARYSALEDTSVKAAVARDFMTCLAQAHLVDPGHEPVPGMEPHGSVRDHLSEFIDGWADRYFNGPNSPDALLEHGLQWLRSSMPETDRRLAYVQGDTGPGNFMFDAGRVTAIVDWELAHLGDPFEDLGWLSMRAAQEPMPDFARRIEEYAAALGEQLDLPAIRYYRVLAEWTIALIGHLKSRHGLGDSERGNAFVYEQLHRRLLLEALSDADDVALPLLAPVEFGDTDRTWLYDMALEQQRISILPHIEDPLAARRAKGVARTLRYLKQVDRAGTEPEDREKAALAELLGMEIETIVAGRLEVVDGIRNSRWDTQSVRRYLWHRTWLDNEVHGEAMGRLRDRHLDPLPNADNGRYE